VEKPETAALTLFEYVHETVLQAIASLNDEQRDAIRFLTRRAPDRKPKNIAQGVCLHRLGRHELAQGIFVELARETSPTDRWPSFTLTPLGVAVRGALS
jgi:hypothetical protein